MRVGKGRADRGQGVGRAELEVDDEVKPALTGLLQDRLALRHDVGRLNPLRLELEFLWQRVGWIKPEHSIDRHVILEPFWRGNHG